MSICPLSLCLVLHLTAALYYYRLMRDFIFLTLYGFLSSFPNPDPGSLNGAILLAIVSCPPGLAYCSPLCIQGNIHSQSRTYNYNPITES